MPVLYSVFVLDLKIIRWETKGKRESCTMKNEAGRRTDNVKMTDLLLGQLERGSASARLDRVFRRDQAYCPTRREADFEDAGLSSGAAIEFVT